LPPEFLDFFEVHSQPDRDVHGRGPIGEEVEGALPIVLFLSRAARHIEPPATICAVMAHAGFVVTKMARSATAIGGRLTVKEKARANRRNRRAVREQVRTDGAEVDIRPPRLWTDWDVI
jgi:hypothetical protein